MFNVVLVEPRIPQNTGNIARTCAATGCRLHIVRPTAFQITDKNLKRAGLDYWHLLNVCYYDNLADFFEKTEGARYFYATTKAPQTYTDVHYEEDCYIMFGKESAGIPEEILIHHKEDSIRIPMVGDIRSLNLGNSVAIVLYEALRQNGFQNMTKEGRLHRLEWD